MGNKGIAKAYSVFLIAAMCWWRCKRPVRHRRNGVQEPREVRLIAVLAWPSPTRLLIYVPWLIQDTIYLSSDYGDDDVSWSCTADVPGYFKLGSTDVFCEGYDHPDDPFVLRGSCGVEYRLQLTDAGYEKFGHSYMPSGNISRTAQVLGYFFIAIWIVFAIGACWRGRAQNGLGGGGGGYGGGGGGGGGGGWGGIDSDPPPPYPGTGRPKTQYSGASSTSTGGGGWRPGFWTGAATGAAASHLYSRSRDSNRDRGYTAGDGGFSSTAGPSRSAGWNGGGPGSSSSGGAESATRSTTGFGQTRRR